MNTRTRNTETRAAGSPVRIEPDSWYTDADLRLILHLPGATLQRARRMGDLRHTRRGGKAWHLGEWVNGWLSGQQMQGVADVR